MRLLAMVWRSPMKMAAMKQFLSEVNWGDLDFLLVDLPRGTSDEPISVVQLISDLDGAIICIHSSRSGIAGLQESSKHVPDDECRSPRIVENMSEMRCPHCDKLKEVFKMGSAEIAARELDVDIPGAIPLDLEIDRLGDQGVAFEGRKTRSEEAFGDTVSQILNMI
jgi:ATP-binding protein involved in chromosome partitioning